MNIPRIKTAIPKRRYQIGTFSAVILGEIESEDGINYRNICAMVADGATEPLLYIMHIRDKEGETVRIASVEQSQDLTPPEPIKGIDDFCEQVLPIAQKLLSLTDEMPARLM